MIQSEVIFTLAKQFRNHEDTFPVADVRTIRATENALGFPLPPLLWDLYTQVGSVGMGPSQGAIIGLYGGFLLYGESLPDVYKEFRQFDEYPFLFEGAVQKQWPERLVPLCTWAGDMYSCVFCTTEDAPIYAFNSNFIESDRADLSGVLLTFLADKFSLGYCQPRS